MKRLYLKAGDSSGMALLITLLVMVILAVMVHQFTFSTRVHLAAAANVRDQLKAEYMAFSGVEAALAVLKQNGQEQLLTEESEGAGETKKEGEEREKGEQGSGLEEIQSDNLEKFLALSQKIQELGSAAMAEGEGSFKVVLHDESAKIDINRLVSGENVIDNFIENQLRRLLRLFGHTDDEVDGLMDALVDWLDKDEDRRPEGAEDVDYQSLDEPYDCRDGPLRTLGELTLVKGWKGFWDIRLENGTALADCLTVGPTGGRININTASPVVLQSFSEGIDEGVADEIVARRDELPFDDTADLFVLLGFLTKAERDVMSAHLQIKSSLLAISSEGSYRRAVARMEVRVEKHEEALKIVNRRLE